MKADAASTDLNFTTEPIETRIGQDEIEFTLDGHTYRASRPAESYFERIIAAMSSMATPHDKVFAVLHFLDGCVNDDSRGQIEHRYADPADPLKSHTQLIPVAFGLAAAWGVDTSEWELPAAMAVPPARKAPPKKAVPGALRGRGKR